MAVHINTQDKKNVYKDIKDIVLYHFKLMWKMIEIFKENYTICYLNSMNNLQKGMGLGSLYYTLSLPIE